MITAIKNAKRLFSQNGGGGSGSSLTLTTTGTSGPATLTGSALNIPEYSTLDVQTVTSAATVTPTSSNDEVVITAQAVALALANPTGTPAQGQAMTIRIKDDGTARAITYDTQYRAVGVSLPTSTTISKTLYLGLIYNATDTKWDVVGVSLEGADPVTDSGWIDYSNLSTIVGWSSFTTKEIKYRIIGKQIFVNFRLEGTSNSTTTTFTVPNTTVNLACNMINTNDNGVAYIGVALIGASSSIISFSRYTAISTQTSTWTASGTKLLRGQINFEIV